MPAKNHALASDFSQGNLFRKMVAFALPLFLSNLLQMVYNMVDVAIVGNVIGEVGLSGVSIGGDITGFLTFIAVGFAEAGQVIISQKAGGGRYDEAKNVFGNLCSLLACMAVAATLIGTVLCTRLLALLSTPAEAWQEARAYTFTCAFGMAFIFGYNAVGSILRGIGDSKGPFLFIGASTVANIVLDVLFVIALDMRSFGAALATVISQATSFVLSIIYLRARREKLPFVINIGDFRFRKEIAKTIIGLGIPMALRHTAVQVSRLFVCSWVNSYGVVVSAVAGIGHRINAISSLSANSLHTAGSSMIGQNIGAKTYSRVPRIMLYVFIVAASFALLFSALMFFIPDEIFSLMTNDYVALRNVATEYIPITYIIFGGVAARAPMNAIINGGGSYKVNLAVALLDGVILRIGLSVILGLMCDMGYMGFWLGDALAGFTPLFVGGIYLLSGKWKKQDMRDPA